MLSGSMRHISRQPILLSRRAAMKYLMPSVMRNLNLTAYRLNSTGNGEDKEPPVDSTHKNAQFTSPPIDDMLFNIHQISQQAKQEGDRNIAFEAPDESELSDSHIQTAEDCEEILYDPNEGKSVEEIDFYNEDGNAFDDDYYLLPDEEEETSTTFKLSETGESQTSISEDLLELATLNQANQYKIQSNEQKDTADDAFGNLFTDNEGVGELTNELFLTAKDSRMTRHKTLFENVSEQLDPLLNPNHNKMLDSMDLDKAMDSLLVFKKSISDEEAFQLMDGMRPIQSKISPTRYKQLVDDMQTFFSRDQIRLYIQNNFPKANLSQKLSKPKLVKALIGKHWGIKKSAKVEDTDVIVESKIQLNNSRDMFLVLSSKGYFLNYWSKLGAQLFLNIEEGELVVRGMADTVKFVEVSWSSLLARVHTVELKLDGLLKVKNENLGNNSLIVKEFPMNKFNVSSNVYCDKISDSDQLYLLSFFKPNDLKTLKSQILSYVNYFPHVNKNKVLDITFVDEQQHRTNTLMSRDISVPWLENVTGSFYRYESKRPRLKKSEADEFNLYSNVEFASEDLIETEDYLTQVSKSKQTLQHLVNETIILKDEFNRAQDSFELNNLNGGDRIRSQSQKRYDIPKSAFDERLTPHSTFESEYPDSVLLKEAYENENGLKDELYENEKVNEIYESLSNDNSKDDSIVHGNEVEKWIPKSYSVSYGKVIFNDPSHKLTQESDYFFHSDMKEVNSRLGKLELFDKDITFIGATGDIRNAFRRFIQVSLVPDGFENIANLKQYPKVEIWFDVIANKITTDHPMCFVLENESSYHLPVPTFKHDMKFQSSSNSYLFSDQDSDLFIQQKQPSLYGLIQNMPSILLTNQTNIFEAYDYLINHEYRINIGGSEISYLVNSVTARRSIELMYENNIVIYDIYRDISSVNNSTKYEVSLLGDVKTGEDFEDFYQTSVDFLRFLN